MKISINTDKAVKNALNNFDKYDKDTQDRIEKVVENTTSNVETKAKAKAPFRTGKLKSSISSTMKNKTTGIVKATSPTAHLVELGTVLRITAPKKKQALKIGDSFVKKVISTGQVKPKPFLKPAAEEVKDKFVSDLSNAINPKK
jgi:HK97 gp10 family phage protein